MDGARGSIRGVLLAMDQAAGTVAAGGDEPGIGELSEGLKSAVEALRESAARLGHAVNARERALGLAGFQLAVEEIARLIEQLLPLRVPHEASGGHCTVSDALASVSGNFCDPRFRGDVTVKVVIDEPALADVIRLAPGNAALMVSNLVDNAVRRSAMGGKVLVCATAAAERLSIEVLDYGPAISEQALARIIDRLDQSVCSTASGVMGLFISRQLAELAGGSLSLRNLPDCTGLIARVDLPRAHSAA
jgi:signal transduction histidine kinase